MDDDGQDLRIYFHSTRLFSLTITITKGIFSSTFFFISPNSNTIDGSLKHFHEFNVGKIMEQARYDNSQWVGLKILMCVRVVTPIHVFLKYFLHYFFLQFRAFLFQKKTKKNMLISPNSATSLNCTFFFSFLPTAELQFFSSPTPMH